MLVILILFVFLALWAGMHSRADGGGLRVSFIKTLVCIFAFTTVTTEFLSLFNLLGVYLVAVVWFAAFAGIVYFFRADYGLFFDSVRTALRIGKAFPVAVTVLILITTAIIALASPPNTYDSQTYHLARVASWIQNGSVANYPTAILRQLYQPPLAEFAILHLQLLSGSDWPANTVQWIALVGCVVTASRIVAEFGLPLKFQMFAAALVVTIPGAVVQGSSTQNDLLASFFVIAFFFLFKRATRSDQTAGYVWAGVALGLALLTKSTTYLFCFPIGVFFLTVRFFEFSDKAARFKFARRIALLLVVGFALNFGHFARNTALFGSPISSGDDEVRNRNITVRMVLANVARNFAVNLGSKSQTLQAVIEGAMTRTFGDELKNPNSTWLDNQFKVEFSTHEDLAGNFVHALLFAIALITLVFGARRNRDIDVYGAVFTIVFGFLMFSALLKWQIWTARLQLPLLILGTVLIAYVVAKLTPRFVPTILVAICFAAVVPYLLFAEPRRVFSNDGKFVLFSETREQKLFKNLPDAGPIYAEAIRVIRAQPDPPNSVGIAIEYNDYEYPIWYLLKSNPADRPALCHVGVTNVSRRLKPVCAPSGFVITTRTENTLDGVAYREIWKRDVLRVLQRAAQ